MLKMRKSANPEREKRVEIEVIPKAVLVSLNPGLLFLLRLYFISTRVLRVTNAFIVGGLCLFTTHLFLFTTLSLPISSLCRQYSAPARALQNWRGDLLLETILDSEREYLNGQSRK